MLRPWFIPRISSAVTVLTAGGAWSVFGLLLIVGAACAEMVSSDPLITSEVAAVKGRVGGSLVSTVWRRFRYSIIRCSY